MIRTISVFVLLAVAAAGTPAIASDYVVGENDVLKITVYDHPDLSTTVRVSGSGRIVFPLIGQVLVDGLKVNQVEQRLEELLADGYIIKPQVSVFVQEFRSRKVTILGEVLRSGLYELSGKATLLEIISKAGGLTKDAGDRAVIKRKNGDGDDIATQTIDLTRLVEEGDNSLNVEIGDGDSVFIPRAGYFFVTGEVEKPGSYKYSDGMTVRKAITMAEGFTTKAAKRKVRLIRRLDGKDTIRRVQMDEIVLPDDVLDVPESFF